MPVVKLDVLEKNCPKCNGDGKIEVYSTYFWKTVDELEDTNQRSTKEAHMEARELHKDEISSEVCDYCRGRCVVPNINGKAVLKNETKVLEFIKKYSEKKEEM
ncbi:hypothetical protein CIB95_15540 [Lottiidibacillus patelloidae]|uniref:Uncharacterized protein n=1 Tax=Lottiidibacillus patelloidae TaxID=2670334 RepID=A0A263BPT8_9BACI|nr:hypothetical protein [Lottiidibacillus patelloidae]OZM55774.1 hypothetical protein CIB95_15540 [Lottiidibacillus patelloidae]